MSSRIVKETPCEHGNWPMECNARAPLPDVILGCSGGSRVVLEKAEPPTHQSYEVTQDAMGFWFVACGRCNYQTDPVPSLDLAVDLMMIHAVDAALGGGVLLTETDQ